MSALYIARSPRLAARKLDGQMVLLSAADSGLFVLNETATALWEAADGVTPLSDIVDRVICPVFEVDAETGLRDSLEFVGQLERHQVLLVSSQPISDPVEGIQA